MRLVTAHRVQRFDPDGTPGSKNDRDEPRGQHCQGNTGDCRWIDWENSKHQSLHGSDQSESRPGSHWDSGKYQLHDPSEVPLENVDPPSARQMPADMPLLGQGLLQLVDPPIRSSARSEDQELVARHQDQAFPAHLLGVPARAGCPGRTSASSLAALVRDESILGRLELSGSAERTVLVTSHDIHEVERLVGQRIPFVEGDYALPWPARIAR